MSIQFPDAPFQGQSFVASNGVSYTYDNGGWIANSQSGLDDRYVNLDGDSMTGDLTVPSLNGGQLAGFRNQIINGDFRVWQRGNNGTVSGGSVDFYPSADRWAVNNNQSLARNSSTTQVPSNLQFDRSATSSNGQTVQAIELNRSNQRSPFVAGTQWTLSFYSNGTPRDCSLNFQAGAYQDSGNAVSAATPVTPVALSSADGNGFVRYAATFTLNNSDPISSHFALTVTVRYAQESSSDYVTGIQFEPGPVATPFEHRPIGTELALCQRYYQKLDIACTTSGYANHQRGYASYPQMRVTPTFVGAENWSVTSAQQTPGTIGAAKDDPNTGFTPQSTTYASIDATGWTATATAPAQGQAVPCRIRGVKLDAEL